MATAPVDSARRPAAATGPVRRNIREAGDRKVRTATVALVAASLAGTVVLTACDSALSASTRSSTTSSTTRSSSSTTVTTVGGSTHATTSGS